MASSAVRFARLIGLAALVASLLAGCGSTARSGRSDKLGGSGAPIVLRLATAADQAVPPEKDWINYFASAARKASHGAVRVHVSFNVAGGYNQSVNADGDVAHLVRAGNYDLGWISARTWDELGVTTLRALQAPFLIDNYALLKRVTESPVAAGSLAGMSKAGVVGLGLVPMELRYAYGRRPFLTPADYAGARVRVFPSRTSDAIFQALGATVVHANNDEAGKLTANGKIDVVESNGAGPPLDEPTQAALFPKFLTVFASQRAYNRLSPAAREALRTAAAQTVARAVGQLPASDQDVVSFLCNRAHARVVQPSAAQLAALERATAPVTSALERDPQTGALIAQIQKLKAAAPAPALVVPTACQKATRTPVPGAGVKQTGSRALDGTYRYVLTKDDARRSVNTPDSKHVDQYPQVFTYELRAGRWRSGDSYGTYAIKGNRLSFNWRPGGALLVFRIRRDSDGALHLTQLNDTNAGDTFVWTTEPWRRIGPAPAKITFP